MVRTARARYTALLLLGSGFGCGSESGSAAASVECQRFASEIVEHRFGPGQDSGQSRFPELIFGPPHGTGCCEGNTNHVVSLGNGGSVTLGFGSTDIVDRDGPDFTVFENAFQVNADPGRLFAELATVEVSDDGAAWHAFVCDAVAPPYGGCAGWHPVYSSPDSGIDPLDPAVAGGDSFDLAELGLSRARYLRITDRADLTGIAGVFDLDAVAVLSAECHSRD